MGKNRLEMRRMAEAAEKIKKTSGETDGKKAKKGKAPAKAKRKTASRKGKDRAHQRKRMVWCVFNGSMKEEGRFPYDKKDEAEAKLELLRSKSKKLYFLQPVKEIIGESSVPASDVLPSDEDLDEVEVAERSDEEEEDEDVDIDMEMEAMDEGEDDDDMGEEEEVDDED
jgi:hypothetical protein